MKRPFDDVYVAVSWSFKEIILQLEVAVHEMLHAVGLMHEQSRSDRDDYIRMIAENLKHNINNGNLAKTSTFDHNPYDYESVMQYGLKVINFYLIIIMIIILVFSIAVLTHTLSHKKSHNKWSCLPYLKLWV